MDLAGLASKDILTLGMQADEVRRTASNSARVYYQRVHAVRSADVRLDLTIPEAASAVRILDTPASLEDAVSLAQTVKRASGNRPLAAYSLADIATRVRSGWGEWPEVLARLAATGISDFSEAPIDLVSDIDEITQLARSVGLRLERLTLANAVGERKLEILERIRHAVSEIGGFGRVNPLPRGAPIDKPTTGYEDVRMVALTRLVLGSESGGQEISVEVDWSLYGPKLAQVALTFGADFLDAVPATNDESLGRRRSTVEEVERNIRAAGFEPQEFRP